MPSKTRNARCLHRLITLVVTVALMLQLIPAQALAETADELDGAQETVDTAASEGAAWVDGEDVELSTQPASVSDPRVVSDSSMKAGQVTTWDCVWLGYYPQTYVDDPTTVAALDVAAGWDEDGDLTYGEATYRRLKKSDANYSNDSAECWSWSDKASSRGYCYFRWDPVKWRVLEANGTQAIVLADIGLDEHVYNPDSITAVWETCKLRSWLGSTFWNTCFTATQQEAIIERTIENASSISYGRDGGADTTDKIFLLSESDVWSDRGEAVRHGFITSSGTEDEARRCQTSDYAQAMGVWRSTSSDYLGNSNWWLRSPGYWSFAAVCVQENCTIKTIGQDEYTGQRAVRPALCVDLTSEQVFYAGTVSSNGDVDEQTAPDVDPSIAPQAASISNPRVVADDSTTAGKVTTWECVWFGSYPQSYVDDTATVAALDEATGWDEDGDLTYDGRTYHRLQRGSATYSQDNTDAYWDWNKASSMGYCYFLWEPVKWRVLETDGSTALIVSDEALDDRKYNELYEAVDWEHSTIRSWLANEFWVKAFTSAQRDAVKVQVLPYIQNNLSYTGNATEDSVFLLADSDACSSTYGFPDNVMRLCKSSDYTRAMGAKTSTSESYLGNSNWWIRSSYDSYATYITDEGVSENGGYVYWPANAVDRATYSVRPAMRVLINSEQVSYAGTVSSNGVVDEQEAPYLGEKGSGGGSYTPDGPGTVTYGTPVDGALDLSFRCQFGGTSTIKTTWADSWLASDYDGYHYNHDLARACSVLATAAYMRDCIQDDLKSLGFVEVESYCPDEDGGYQFDWDECGYTFGLKTVTDSTTGKQVPIIIVAVRGTIGNGEWLGNFNVANSSPSNAPTTHEGFARCKSRVLRALDEWVTSFDGRLDGLDMDAARVLLMGHSRGAAVSSLMAASLDDGYTLGGHTIQAANVCAYTIASPSTSQTEQDKPLYDNIFNFVNPEDLVPKLPLGLWGYQRLGTTFVLPSRTNTGVFRYRSLKSEMNSVFKSIAKDRDYKPYLLGSATTKLVTLELGSGVPTVDALYDLGIWKMVGVGLSPHTLIETIIKGFIMEGDKTLASAALADLARQMPVAAPMLVANFAGDSIGSLVLQGVTTADHVVHGHTPETYISWMWTLGGLGDFASTHTGLMIACPVDVRVYAPDGELVAEIVDGEVNEELLEDGLAAWVDGDAKHVDLPDEEAYRVELTPTADGEMDVALTHYDADDEVIEQLGYDDLALVEGKAYELTTTGNATQETTIEDETSLVDPSSEQIAADYSVTGDEVESIALTAIAEGEGVVVCPVAVTRGDYVTARAIAADGATFTGWYEDGKLVSEKTDYQFQAVSDRALTARFKESGIDISTAEVSIAEQTYTGDALTPKPKVTVAGKELVEGTDYELSYANNVDKGTATVTVEGKGNYAGKTTATFEIVTAWERLAGNGRYDTMAAIVEEGWASETDGTVIVATGEGFKDALAAAGFAGLDNAPVVLTASKSLSKQAEARLKALKPKKIYIVGGTFAVSDGVAKAIQQATGIKPTRAFGANGCSTSAAIAKAGGTRWADTAIIATDRSFKDALSAAPLSYAKHWPIFLSGGGKSLNDDVIKALKDCGIKNAYIVGGELAVTKNVESQLKKAGVEVLGRLAGENGPATSRAIADFALKNGLSVANMAYATSQNFPDALAGAALCGKNMSVLLLCDDKAQSNLSFSTQNSSGITCGYVFGGTIAFSEELFNRLPR